MTAVVEGLPSILTVVGCDLVANLAGNMGECETRRRRQCFDACMKNEGWDHPRLVRGGLRASEAPGSGCW